ncbi:MAG: hypothetical protein ACRDRZ_09755 [Pseudonocardiaceae bacterium]
MALASVDGGGGGVGPPPKPDMTTAGTGVAEVTPEQLREFSKKVGTLNDAIERLKAELRNLQGQGMSVGSGQYARQIVDFYRQLIGTEAAPSVEQAIAGLEALQQAANGSANQWEQTDQGNASQYQA